MLRVFKWMLWGLAGLFVFALFRGPPPETVAIEPQQAATVGVPEWQAPKVNKHVDDDGPVEPVAIPPPGKNKYAEDGPALPLGMARIDGDAIGCTTREAFGGLTRLQVDGDAEAAKWTLLALITRGECRVFHNGDQVYLVETALFSGLASVRPRGEVTAFWTNIERVKNR